MNIHKNFTGGNIYIEKVQDHIVYLNNEQRDSAEDWFYWAFCVENAAGKTITFKFPPVRLGYYGPAISYDLKKWEWLGKGDDVDSFTITFYENKVYFAHSMLYHPDRFYQFSQKNNLTIKELCKSKKGRSVPYVTFGSGKRTILLTARHHACESTGSYVLEGVLEMLVKKPIENTRVICIPFVDFDGVIDGDQGKSRFPHDHNRDYNPDTPAIYPEVKAIRQIADSGILYGFDFHSPWHFHGRNDTIFIVEKSKSNTYSKFSSILENSVSQLSMKYYKRDNISLNTEWNKSTTPCFSYYMNRVAKSRLAFSLETPYFGTNDHIFNQENSVELGRCFADAIRKYDRMKE